MIYRDGSFENRIANDSEWEDLESPTEEDEWEYVFCSECGEKLQIGETASAYDSDDVFFLDGKFYCENCIGDAAKEMFRYNP